MPRPELGSLPGGAPVPDPVAPKICDRKPVVLEVPTGRQAWCSCGHSAKQPWCDGTHNKVPGGFLPVKFELPAPAKKAMCMCKYTGTKPYCDGSHSRLPV